MSCFESCFLFSLSRLKMVEVLVIQSSTEFE